MCRYAPDSAHTQPAIYARRTSEKGLRGSRIRTYVPVMNWGNRKARKKIGNEERVKMDVNSNR